MEPEDKLAVIARPSVASAIDPSMGGERGAAMLVRGAVDGGGGGGSSSAAPIEAAPIEARATETRAIEARAVEAEPIDDEDDEPTRPSPKASSEARKTEGSTKGAKRAPNNVRRLRIERMMSKAELARRANLSVLTIDRIEKGYGCRMDSKRKILEALGLSLADRVRVFGEEE